MEEENLSSKPLHVRLLFPSIRFLPSCKFYETISYFSLNADTIQGESEKRWERFGLGKWDGGRKNYVNNECNFITYVYIFSAAVKLIYLRAFIMFALYYAAPLNPICYLNSIKYFLCFQITSNKLKLH